MFCKYCGSQLDDDSIFCNKCGKKIAEQKTTITTVSTQPVITTSAKPQPTTTQPKTTQSSSATQRKLVIQRKKHLYGCGVSLGILIDGVEKARISNGGEATILISSESHALNIKQDNFGGKFKSKTFVINAGDGDVYGYITPPLFADKWTISFEYM